MRVLVVDDSAVARQILSAVLSREPDIDVDIAADPIVAMARMKVRRPDVIVLDLEMPRMDGLTFLRKIMAEAPTPVVVCSTLAVRGSMVALTALQEGAVEIIAKPQVGMRDFLNDQATMVVDCVRAAARSRLRQDLRREPAGEAATPAVLPAAPPGLIALGASTGGTEAIRQVLQALPVGAPPVAIVQHMPEKFTRSFADQLDRECRLQVTEAVDGAWLDPSQAIVAPGNRHLAVRRHGARFVAHVFDGPLVNRHRPSVDVLFDSLVTIAPDVTAALLTGMGDDGARGLRSLRDAGAATIAQNEESCVVFGMPKEAIALDAAQHVLPLDGIAAALLRRWREAEAIDA